MRVFHDDGTGTPIAYDSDIANGIAWAATHGAKVINLCLGGRLLATRSSAMRSSSRSTRTHAVVVAAGNGNPPGVPTSAPT